MTNESNPNRSNAGAATTRPRPSRSPSRRARPLSAWPSSLIVAVRPGRHRHSAPHRPPTRCWPRRTNELAAPTVIVAAPKTGAPVDSFVLPGNVTAFTDSPIYARTSGYLTHWYFDIGARVKKGALLAEIATPEVDQQLAQAEADLNTAQANANNARIQADRYTGLVKSNAVSRQDTDTFVNQAASTAAAVRSAQANVAATARTAVL